jgi:hypothetical protein
MASAVPPPQPSPRRAAIPPGWPPPTVSSNSPAEATDSPTTNSPAAASNSHPAVPASAFPPRDPPQPPLSQPTPAMTRGLPPPPKSQAISAAAARDPAPISRARTPPSLSHASPAAGQSGLFNAHASPRRDPSSPTDAADGTPSAPFFPAPPPSAAPRLVALPTHMDGEGGGGRNELLAAIRGGGAGMRMGAVRRAPVAPRPVAAHTRVEDMGGECTEGSDGRRDELLAAIRDGGASLRRAAACGGSPESSGGATRPAGQSELLQAIRHGSAALRKVPLTQPSVPGGGAARPAEGARPAGVGGVFGSVSVAAILARRAAIDAASDESDNEDEWGD